MKETKSIKLTQAQRQFVQKKLDDANEYLRKVDVSILFEKEARGNKSKSQ